MATTPPLASRELPRYKCHKEVWALKIKYILIDKEANYHIVPEDEAFTSIPVSREYLRKHNPNSDQPRAMSDKEMDELAADAVLMDELARTVNRIYFIKHMTG